MDDEELALMIKKFKKLNRKGRRFNWKKQSTHNFQKRSIEENETIKLVICFECKKKRHIRPNCPLLKKKKGRTKKYKIALKAETWSDTECEESEEEYANICLMAHSNSNSNSKSDSDFEIYFDSNSDKEVKVSNLKISVKVSKYIDEFCLSLKTSLKRISELKNENSKLRQQETLWKEKFESLDKSFVD